MKPTKKITITILAPVAPIPATTNHIMSMLRNPANAIFVDKIKIEDYEPEE